MIFRRTAITLLTLTTGLVAFQQASANQPFTSDAMVEVTATAAISSWALVNAAADRTSTDAQYSVAEQRAFNGDVIAGKYSIVSPPTVDGKTFLDVMQQGSLAMTQTQFSISPPGMKSVSAENNHGFQAIAMLENLQTLPPQDYAVPFVMAIETGESMPESGFLQAGATSYGVPSGHPGERSLNVKPIQSQLTNWSDGVQWQQDTFEISALGLSS